MRARTALVLAVGLAWGGSAVGFQPPAGEDWLPKMHKSKPGTLAPDWRPSEWIEKPKAPPSAFPELVLPEQKPHPLNQEKRAADFERLCPRLSGALPLKIEPTDTTLRKLLKARIHQAVLSVRAFPEQRGQIGGPAWPDDALQSSMLDILQTATELWADEPKELAAWLSELVILAKEHERVTRVRVMAFAKLPEDVYTATRLRLKVEAELWKVKNPK